MLEPSSPGVQSFLDKMTNSPLKIAYFVGSGETGRRQRFRPFGRPLRRRPVANRRKETSDYEKENGIYDYVDPLSISNIWSSSSTTSEDVHPHKGIYDEFAVWLP